MMEHTKAEKEALDLLPYPLASAAIKCAAQNRGVLHEIRLREGQYLTVTSRGQNLKCGIRCTREDVDHVLRRLCGNSLYSHADTIREGYIAYGNGIRAGVCGRAVTNGGEISAVTDITSVCIRIPHRVRGAADEAYELLAKSGFSCGMLVYSRPGVGKTTLLRELALMLASGENAHRVALIDTRCELAAGIEEGHMIDILSSYPRACGIEIAVRTLSPQFVICDEVSSADDVRALMSAVGAGVNMIASAHGSSYGELSSRPAMRELLETDAFGIYLGLLRRKKGGGYASEISFRLENSDMETEGIKA